MASVTHPYWSLFDLRLATADLDLLVATEADLVPLGDRLPDDVDGEALPTYDIGGRPVARGTVLHQVYWRAFGTWRPDSWTIPFVVLRDGELIGLQALEGAGDFVRLRTVDSFSLLVRQARAGGTASRCVTPCWRSPSARSRRSERSPRPGRTTTRRWASRGRSVTCRTAISYDAVATASTSWCTCGWPVKTGWPVQTDPRSRSPASSRAGLCSVCDTDSDVRRIDDRH